MTHEPECDYAGVMTIGMPCRQCAAIRIAYKRGRHDALVEVWRWTAQKERAARGEDKNV